MTSTFVPLLPPPSSSTSSGGCALGQLSEEELWTLVKAASQSSSPTTVLAGLLSCLASATSSTSTSSTSSHPAFPGAYSSAQQLAAAAHLFDSREKVEDEDERLYTELLRDISLGDVDLGQQEDHLLHSPAPLCPEPGTAASSPLNESSPLSFNDDNDDEGDHHFFPLDGYDDPLCQQPPSSPPATTKRRAPPSCPPPDEPLLAGLDHMMTPTHSYHPSPSTSTGTAASTPTPSTTSYASSTPSSSSSSDSSSTAPIPQFSLLHTNSHAHHLLDLLHNISGGPPVATTTSASPHHEKVGSEPSPFHAPSGGGSRQQGHHQHSHQLQQRQSRSPVRGGGGQGLQQPQQEGVNQFRLSVRVPSLGVFYVFIDPRCKVARLVTMVEQQVAELYRSQISVYKLQDEFSVDLPPSYTVGSMLRNNATVIVDYERRDHAAAIAAHHYQHNNNHHQNFSTQHNFGSASSSHLSQAGVSSSPASSPTIQRRGAVAFSQPQPTALCSTPTSNMADSAASRPTTMQPLASASGYAECNTPQLSQFISDSSSSSSSSSSTTSLPSTMHESSTTVTSTSSLPQTAAAAASSATSATTAAAEPSSPVAPGASMGATADMQFSEQPPAKVFQNKEFSCTILVANQLLESLHNLPDERSRAARAPSTATATLTSPAEPMTTIQEARDDGSSDSGFGGASELLELLPIEVSVVEQNGMVLSDRDYSMRQLLMDKRKGMLIVFIKIRKNSYYGRRPFVVMLRGRRQFSSLPPLFSEPIVVSAKKKKKRSKKVKLQADNDNASTGGSGLNPLQPGFVSLPYPPPSSETVLPPLPSWRPA